MSNILRWCKSNILQRLENCLIIGLPERATPSQEMGCVYVEKDKITDGARRGLCVSHSPFNGADFCVEGTGHFRSSGEQI